jgi:hypothetical protein
MPLIDLIIQDLQKEINDTVMSDIEPDQYSSQEEAYWAGVADASEGAEAYVRAIFPSK